MALALQVTVSTVVKRNLVATTILRILIWLVVYFLYETLLSTFQKFLRFGSWTEIDRQSESISSCGK